MLQKPCRLTRADKCYGGGVSAPDIQQRNFRQEIPDIRRGFQFQQNQYGRYLRTDPFMSAVLAGIGAPGGAAETAAAGGALSPELTRDVDQQTLSLFAARGMSPSPGAIGSELLNRQAYRERRYAGALGQAEQAATTGTQTYSTLTNPILSYLNNLFGGNLQARIAEAQLQMQAGLANQNKTSGLISGGISGASSILGGVIGMSDERIKEDVKDTGVRSALGIPIKTWRYKGDKSRAIHVGHVAQDVEKKRPDAVLSIKIPKAIKRLKLVNYAALSEPQFAAA